jgi:hypothetical protein
MGALRNFLGRGSAGSAGVVMPLVVADDERRQNQRLSHKLAQRPIHRPVLTIAP